MRRTDQSRADLGEGALGGPTDPESRIQIIKGDIDGAVHVPKPFLCNNSSNPHNHPSEGGSSSILIPVLYLRKLRHREVT